MEKLLEVLRDNYPDIDFEAEKSLVTGGILDSVDVVTLIAEIEDAFGVSVSMENVVPENFDSAESMWRMIQSLQ